MPEERAKSCLVILSFRMRLTCSYPESGRKLCLYPSLDWAHPLAALSLVAWHNMERWLYMLGASPSREKQTSINVCNGKSFQDSEHHTIPLYYAYTKFHKGLHRTK